MILLLVLAFIGMALFEAPGLVRRRWWRELAVFAATLGLAFMLSLMRVIGVDLPNPNKIITLLVHMFLNVLPP